MNALKKPLASLLPRKFVKPRIVAAGRLQRQAKSVAKPETCRDLNVTEATSGSPETIRLKASTRASQRDSRTGENVAFDPPSCQ